MSVKKMDWKIIDRHLGLMLAGLKISTSLCMEEKVKLEIEES